MATRILAGTPASPISQTGEDANLTIERIYEIVGLAHAARLALLDPRPNEVEVQVAVRGILARIGDLADEIGSTLSEQMLEVQHRG